MPLIKPKQKREKIQVRINIDTKITEEMKRYCEYAGFNKFDDFFEEAALHILNKDKSFKEWKENKNTHGVD